MNPLHIDFAPPSLRRELYRTRLIARVFAVAALTLSIVAGFRVHALLNRIDTLDREAVSLQARSGADMRHAMALARKPIDAKQAEAINAAVARLNLPWADILDALEAATPEQVSVLSVRPEPRGAQIKIEAQSSRAEDMIGYLTALEQQPAIGHVFLTKHERVRDGFAEVIRFQIEVQWRGAAL
ncbi:PilN domain-containing protein [Trinickia sp.]|uniref:PilN domain-containing protein n=1 Tax=Trinickia sp. TaxID=2571163 RepID=UPI003F810E73